MKREYEFIELIDQVQQTETGLNGLMNFDKAKKKISEYTKAGWVIHTLFPDPHGTCLLEREKKWYQFWK